MTGPMIAGILIGLLIGVPLGLWVAAVFACRARDDSDLAGDGWLGESGEHVPPITDGPEPRPVPIWSVPARDVNNGRLP